MKFDDILNQEKPFEFYGVYNNCFKLGDTIFEAIEDEADGYRSYLETIELTTKKGIFPKKPIALVRIDFVASDPTNYEEAYRLVDINTGHIWLKVGTDELDGYYPCFMFDYSVPETVQEFDSINACPKNYYPELFI